MMKWYEGGIAEAVTLSRKNGSIFVVYIEGSDDKSKKLTEILESEKVSLVLGSGSFVALKLEANSVPHQQFSEIYFQENLHKLSCPRQVMRALNRKNFMEKSYIKLRDSKTCPFIEDERWELSRNKQTSIPSIYFIGKTGTPLEIVTEVKDDADILAKMNNAVIKNGGAPLNIKSEDLIEKEATHEVVCDGDVCQLAPKPGTSQSVIEEKPAEKVIEEKPAENHVPTNTNTDIVNDDESEKTSEDPSLSTEEKLKLAQDLIEKKRAQKKVEEEEAQKQKEVERRKLGQDVQKMKRWQQEQEMKQLMEERQREKREEQEARDKVKRQIEEDKREKAARLAAANQNQQDNQEPPRNLSPRPTNSHTARLQFRLPNGTSHMHDFPSSSLLREVNEYIKTNVPVGGNFVLATMFPRREFNENDASQSLLDLQLVPNAVILVLPVSHGAVVTGSSSGFMGMIWFVLAPIFNFFGYVKDLIFGKPAPATARDSVKNEGPDSGPSSSRPMPKKRAGESVIRRHGNIHRLTDRDSDDENNTWNGNSTQQM